MLVLDNHKIWIKIFFVRFLELIDFVFTVKLTRDVFLEFFLVPFVKGLSTSFFKKKIFENIIKRIV